MECFFSKQKTFIMKKLGLITLLSVAAFSFQACNSEPKDSKELADSLNKMADSSKAGDSIVAMQAPKDDADFATDAAIGGMAEVEFSKLALAKTTNGKVKDFATMMVNDHGKANQDLMAIAKSKSISLPLILDDKHQKDLDDLNKKTGADFDKIYVDHMVDDHQKKEKLLKDQAENGTDQELKAFARKTLPVVQAHLETIKNIKKSM
jgi:putative membrane protein